MGGIFQSMLFNSLTCPFCGQKSSPKANQGLWDYFGLAFKNKVILKCLKCGNGIFLSEFKRIPIDLITMSEIETRYLEEMTDVFKLLSSNASVDFIEKENHATTFVKTTDNEESKIEEQPTVLELNDDELQISGYIVNDPELRYNEEGIAVCNFSIQTDETAQDIKIWCFRRMAENVAEYLSKNINVKLNYRIIYRDCVINGFEETIVAHRIIS